MLMISIDGACRRNGKPDCVAAGGVFVADIERGNIVPLTTISSYETGSTNQRGELLALLEALKYVLSSRNCANIVTDSEYLFNTMYKEWYTGWRARDWKTSTGEPVKNRDLWEKISDLYDECADACLEVVFFHIKGHCIPFGKVTATSLLNKDNTGKDLCKAVLNKYESCKDSKADQLSKAEKLSEKNNGFALGETFLRTLVVMNVMADAIATRCVEAADSLMD